MIVNLKPDLIIHPRYASHFLNFDLDTYFNVLCLDELMNSAKIINPVLVSDDDISILNNLTLTPVFNKTLSRKSGIKPEYTSYNFKTQIPIYKIPHRAPRYVIWNKSDDLTICATCVDRVDKHNLFAAYIKAKDWAYAITQTKSIIVFDLDETLIDKNCKKLKYADELLQRAREVYDAVVLYSHGSNLHVDDNATQFNTAFDLVLSHNSHDKISNKNLLYLYNYFPYTTFSRATLVDDSLYNWTPEYDTFIVPYQLTSVHNVIPLLQ